MYYNDNAREGLTAFMEKAGIKGNLGIQEAPCNRAYDLLYGPSYLQHTHHNYLVKFTMLNNPVEFECVFTYPMHRMEPLNYAGVLATLYREALIYREANFNRYNYFDELAIDREHFDSEDDEDEFWELVMDQDRRLMNFLSSGPVDWTGLFLDGEWEDLGVLALNDEDEEEEE